MSNWKEFSLGDIADPSDRYSFSGGPFGSNLKSEEYTTSGVRIIQLQNIGDGIFKDDYKIYTSKEKADELFSCNIFPGEIILSKMGDPVARATLIPDTDERYLMASDGIRLRSDQTRIDPTFMLNAINSPQFRETAEVVSVGSTRKRIGLTTLKGLTIYAPPLPEQKKIAEILSGIDLQISNAKVKVEKHRHLLNGIINQLMTFGTRGQKVIETDAGSYPENWRIGKVEDFFTLGRGRVISIPYIKEHPGPYPVFSSQSKNNGEMGRMDTYDFDGDYFTWTTDGAYAGSVFSRSGKFNCTNVCGTGKAKSSNESDAKFASYFLQRVAKRHVSYVGNPKLMNNVFAKIPFALPPIDEQSEINSIIDAAKRNIDLVEKQVASLSNLKNSISSDLLSGRKRVSV